MLRFKLLRKEGAMVVTNKSEMIVLSISLTFCFPLMYRISLVSKVHIDSIYRFLHNSNQTIASVYTRSGTIILIKLGDIRSQSKS